MRLLIIVAALAALWLAWLATATPAAPATSGQSCPHTKCGPVVEACEQPDPREEGYCCSDPDGSLVTCATCSPPVQDLQKFSVCADTNYVGDCVTEQQRKCKNGDLVTVTITKYEFSCTACDYVVVATTQGQEPTSCTTLVCP